MFGKGLMALILYCSVLAVNAQDEGPVDVHASPETRNLYRNLRHLAARGFLVGHQDDLAYGVQWRYVKGRSDVLEVTGSYPALYGWDLGGIERENSTANLDGVPFKKMKQFIREAYGRGGVITISWHVDSPFGYPKGAWDTTHGTVTSVLPGGINHELFKGWLDKVAGFIGSLKGTRGEPIPILFRPFHELTGGWFWWGKGPSTTMEFTTLWRFVYYYLQQEKKLHNLLWVYNTGGDFHTEQEFLERYPGDEFADVLSFDTYQYNDPATDSSFVVNTRRSLDLVAGIAGAKKKLFALAETGYEAIPYPTWWTGILARILGNQPVSYVLLWRNHGYNESMKKMHYYMPYKGQASEEDFRKFYRLDRTLFESDLGTGELYH